MGALSSLTICSVTALALTGIVYEGLVLSKGPAPALKNDIELTCRDERRRIISTAQVPSGHFVQVAPIATSIKPPGLLDFQNEVLLGNCSVQRSRTPVRHVSIAYNGR